MRLPGGGLIDRYLAAAVLGGAGVALAVLLALFAFGSLVNELEEVGRGGYTVALALEYVLLGLPTLAHQLLPVAALLGAMLGLGALAAQRELVALRAAGASVGRLLAPVLLAALVLAGAAAALGELVAPAAERQARALRAAALGGGGVGLEGSEGVWLRQGGRFVHAARAWADGTLEEVTVYRLGPEGLAEVIRARRARREEGGWLLEEVVRSRVAPEAVASRRLERLRLRELVDPALLGLAGERPRSLPVAELLPRVRRLERSGLDVGPYASALWAKLMAPWSTAVMVLLAVPFVLGPLGRTGVGPRLVAGTLVGMAYYLLSRGLAHAALAYQLSPALAHALPPLLFLGLGLALLRRVP